MDETAMTEAPAELLSWRLHDGKPQREFGIADFVPVFGFVGRAALVAERMDQHPQWCNVCKRVRVDLTTREAGGISQHDIQPAVAMVRLGDSDRLLAGQFRRERV